MQKDFRTRPVSEVTLTDVKLLNQLTLQALTSLVGPQCGEPPPPDYPMNPEIIRIELNKHRPELHVQELDSGFSFWLRPKNSGQQSNRIIRVKCDSLNGSAMLKRSVTARLHGDDGTDRAFSGDVAELLEIVDREIALLTSTGST
jgi:hypothetical protein